MLDRYGDEHPDHFDAGAIAHCGMCDETGYRGHLVCDHIDYQAAAKRGMDMVREALEATKKRKEKNT
jgi:hypothetical protein